MKLSKISFVLMFGLSLFSCSKLDEELRGTLTEEQAQEIADVNVLMQAVYNSLRLPYQEHERVFSLQQVTTDETVVPTRGGDWDDNGNWRVLTTHDWTADHSQIGATFDLLLQAVFNATNVLNFDATDQQKAEARFVRAFVMFSVLDLFGQVPIRETGENLLNPPKVLKGIEAWNFILEEVNAIKDQLPAGPANRANKDAAKVLLMKLYLNKGAFTSRSQPTFDAADMDQVIANADLVINSGKYSLSDNVFDNYAPDNDTKSKENIFTNENVGGVQGGRVQTRFNMTAHYNQLPSGWNGFTTLAEVYDKFEAGDQRRGGSYPGMTNISGMRVGLQLGQQFDKDGKALKDRKGGPLAFTRQVDLIEGGDDIEVAGIRVQRYVVDYSNGNGQGQGNNDYVFYRYADVLLMKAEALLRKNNAAAALPIVNQVRVKRGASALTSVNLDLLLDERQREFYWDGWRRQDMIRFGKFLAPTPLRSQASNPRNLYFPIPNPALAVNPNLEQNEGYTQ